MTKNSASTTAAVVELQDYPTAATSASAHPAAVLRPGQLEANASFRRRIAESYPFSPQKEHLGELGDLEDEARDPLLLKDKIQKPELVKRTSSFKGAVGGGKGAADQRRERKLQAFYKYQNERIRDFLKPLVQHAQEAKDEEEAHQLPVKIAVNASLVCNTVLAIIQIYAAVSSLSLSFFASAIDAIFDPAVTILIWWLTKKAAKADPQKWPAGGSRMINSGSVVYSLVMAAASLILIVQCIQELARQEEASKFHLPSTIVVAIAVATKFALFCYCYGKRSYGPECRVLYEDHRNDLGLNSFALITNALGAKTAWWIDPAGAIAISVILIYLWGGSALRELFVLSGVAAPKEIQQLVIYKAMTFSDQILQVDSCRVYHCGTTYVVEVDVVMPPETSLAVSHDISQILQDQLETLPLVERCFVHVDYETSHAPEHRKFY